MDSIFNSELFRNIFSALIGGGVISAIINYIQNKRKTEAEAEKLTIESYSILTKDLHDEINRLKADILQLRQEQVEFLRNSNLILTEKHHLENRIVALENENISLKREITLLQGNIQPV